MRKSIKDWTVSFQNSYVEVLTPNMTIFGDRAFKEEIQAKQGIRNKL